MLALRVYIIVLALLFCWLSISANTLGFLTASVISCSILFLLFDIKSDLNEIKQFEEKLEKLISVLGRDRI